MRLLHWQSIQIPRVRAIVAFALVASLALVRSSRFQADETLPFVIQDAVYRTNLAISNLDADPAQVSIFLYDNSGHLGARCPDSQPGHGQLE